MTTITELQARARALSSRTETDSITPEEVGGLQRDSIDYMAELERSGKSLGIRKVYASVDEMEAAGTSPVGEDGKALKYGQLASIYHAGNAGTENGNIYAFQNPGWLLVGNVAGQKVDIVQSAGDSESAAMSQKAVTALLTEYDVSAANGGRAYTLADAIAAVPAEFQKPGLKLSFVDSASGMQTMYRCISRGWSTAVTDWICVESAEDADGYLYTVVDSDGRIVFGIREDGSVDWSKGIPDHIKAKLNEMMSGLSGKQDAVAGKSLVSSEVADAQDAVSDGEYRWALTDADGRIVFGIREDGSMVYAKSDMLPSACMSDEDYLEVRTDAAGKVLSTIDHAGREVHYNPVCFHNVRMPSGAVRDAVAPLVDERIAAAMSGQQPETGLPGYWKPYLEERVRQIDRRMLQMSGRNVNFIWFTDLHLPANRGKSAGVIEYLLQFSNINRVFCGGDIPQAWGVKEDLLDVADEFKATYYRRISPYGRLYCVEGNHDYTINGKTVMGYTFPIQFSRNLYMGRMSTYGEVVTNVDDPAAIYYYADDTQQGVRYVVVNTTDSANAGATNWQVLFTMGRKQTDWLAREAVGKCPAGYRLIFIAHVAPITPRKVGHQTAYDFIGAVAEKKKVTVNGTEYDFSSAPDVVMCLAGHYHRDEATYSKNLLWVSTACDAAYGDYKAGQFGSPSDYPEKIQGTVCEQTLDCVGVDLHENVVEFLRVGGGYDRRYHTDILECAAGGSLQLHTDMDNPVWMCCDDTGNSDTNHIWKYKTDIAEVAGGLVSGKKKGYAVVCAKNAAMRQMEIFGIRII